MIYKTLLQNYKKKTANINMKSKKYKKITKSFIKKYFVSLCNYQLNLKCRTSVKKNDI